MSPEQKIPKSLIEEGVSAGGGSNITDKIEQPLKNFANWLLEMSKKALDNLTAIVVSIISFSLKATAGIVGFLAEHSILFVIALAFALYEALKISYNYFKQRHINNFNLILYMKFGKYLSLARKERQLGGIKVEKTHYSVNYNPSTLQ